MFEVVVTDDLFTGYDVERSVFEPLGVHFSVCRALEDDEIMERCRHADAILVNQFKMTGERIRQLTKCKVISRYGVGYDNVDVDAATERGIWVARVPDYCMNETAEQAFALMLSVARQITFRDRQIRHGRWRLDMQYPIYRMEGRVLGVVGFGSIGQTLVRKASSFGFSSILVADHRDKAGAVAKAGACQVSLEELLREADYISLHVPLTPETRHLIGIAQLEMMKPTSILVNTSRGPVVDEKALTVALQKGIIAGAGLDVYESEPLAHDNELRACDTVILSDHNGYYSEHSIIELKQKTAENAALVLSGLAPKYPLNTIV